jgi:hypothetical protein
MNSVRWLALSLLLAAPAAAVDDLDNPNQPGGSGRQGAAFPTPFGVDAASPSSGALSLSIPIGPRYAAGGRLSYQLTLTYTSLIWAFTPSAMQAVLSSFRNFPTVPPSLRQT